MESWDAVSLGREAIRLAMVLSAPMLTAALASAVVVGLLQIVTQLHDQSVAFVPKLIAVVLVFGLCMPWLVERTTEDMRATWQETSGSVAEP